MLATLIVNPDWKYILTAAELESISTGFAIGFGSFVDKNTLPFALNSYER